MTETMPHRIEPLCAIIVTLATTTVSALSSIILAAAVGILPELQTTLVDATGPIILDDGKMRIVCVIGAVGGSLLTALILTPPRANGIQFARKVVASQISGVLFTPVIFHWFGWVPTVDNLIAIAAVVSMLSVGVIRLVVPLYTKTVAKWFGVEVGDDRYPDNKDDDKNSPS